MAAYLVVVKLFQWLSKKKKKLTRRNKSLHNKSSLGGLVAKKTRPFHNEWPVFKSVSTKVALNYKHEATKVLVIESFKENSLLWNCLPVLLT